MKYLKYAENFLICFPDWILKTEFARLSYLFGFDPFYKHLFKLFFIVKYRFLLDKNENVVKLQFQRRFYYEFGFGSQQGFGQREII